MLKRLVRATFLAVTGGVALSAGVLMALTLTPTGRGLLARTVARALDGAVLGRVEIGAIGGSFVRDLTFRGLVVRDTAGELVARVPEARVRFTLSQLLRRNFVFSEVTLERPDVRLVRYRNGRMNYEEVLRLGAGTGGGTPPLVQLYNVRVNDGMLTLTLPWKPKVRSAAARDSARTAQLKAHPGRRIERGRDGLVQVMVFESLTTRVAYLLASSPTRKPIAVKLDTLAVRISDPQLRVTDASGQVELRSDTLAFQLQHLALPNTEAIGGGLVSWPNDTILFDFRFNAPRIDLRDLRFVSPGFPAMRGRGSVVALSESGTRTSYAVRNLVLLDGRERIDGELVALVDQRRGLGVRALRLSLTGVDLAKVRPYVDSLPFRGTLDGALRADGFLSDLDLSLDWRYTDADLRDRPVTRVRGEGHVRLGAAGLAFDQFEIANADLALGTVRRLAPVVPLEGRVDAEGTLDGTLRDAAFNGRMTHRDGELPASTAAGRFRLRTDGAEPVFDLDAELEPLAFDGIRPAFPSLTLLGAVQGRVQLAGTMARLAASVDLTGDLGAVAGRGMLSLAPSRLEADSLELQVAALDLAQVRRGWPTSALTGRLRATGVLDSAGPPVGSVQLDVGPSTVRALGADTASFRAIVRNGVLTIDTLDVRWNDAVLAGSGTLGWTPSHSGRFIGALTADSLARFDSVATAFAGALAAGDTSIAARTPLGGRVRVTMAASGDIDSLDARADLELDAFRWRGWRTPSVTGAVTWQGGALPTIATSLRVDTLRSGESVYRSIAVDVGGPIDLLAWSGAVRVGGAARFDARGRLWTRLAPMITSIDTLVAGLPSREWSLESPVAVSLNDSVQAITPVALRTADGSGRVDIVGRVPGAGEGGLSLAVLGLDLKDIYTFLQRDTVGVSGTVSLTGELDGTAAAPRLVGAVAVEGLSLEKAQLPLAQGTVKYADRSLEGSLALWRTGEPVLQLDATLPLDLAWRNAGPRLVPDQPVLLRAKGDSVDLAILEAVSTTLRDVSGVLTVDLRSEGTWGAPKLSGFAEVRDGRMSVRGLGTSFTGMRGRLELAGDSLSLRNVRLEGTDEGRLDLGGVVHFPPGLAQPELDLVIDADRFRAMDVPSFLTLTGSGQLTLRGPFLGATLRGSATATKSALWFADLVNKRVINIDDPALADLIAADTATRVQLRPGLSARFFEGLVAEDFALTIGDEVRLRSNEADILLSGDLRVNKRKRIYRFDGTLNADRGVYKLPLLGGVISRDFTVERGTVRFFGRTDLNAELDIQARHLVRAARGDEVPVIARIEGTLYAPKVRLESTPERPLSEADLASYLVQGSAIGEVTGSGVGAPIGDRAIGDLTSSLLNQFVGEAISNLGVPFLDLQLRLSTPGVGGTTQQQFQAGVQLTPRTYLLLNGSLCPGQGFNGGIALQYRFSRAFRFQTSIEPRTQFCGNTGGSLGTGVIGRQFGADLLFEKEF